ncbi:MAG: type II toxin-antitoxin system VapC family toxin [Mycobacterium sp.]
MIVVDASAALSGLLNNGQARQLLGRERLHAPHLIDSEIASAFRRQVQKSRVTATDGWNALAAWRRIALTRYPVVGLLDRVWELRDNLSAYDASYVALAEKLDCALVTADSRLSNAAQLRCPITVVPH